MGTGWAVGSATTLGFAAAAIIATATDPTFAGLALIPALCGYAYSISLAAHGGRAGLFSLATYATAATAMGAFIALSPDPIARALGILTALVSATSAIATIRELRGRRGVLHVSALLGMLLLLAMSGIGLALLR